MRKPEPDANAGLGVVFVGGEAMAGNPELPQRVVWLHSERHMRRKVPPSPRSGTLPSAHVLLSTFWPSNFGHVLGDDVLPAWAAGILLGVDGGRAGALTPVLYSDLSAIGAPDKRVDLGKETYGVARKFLAELFHAGLGTCSASRPPPVLGLDPPFQPVPHSILHAEPVVGRASRGSDDACVGADVELACASGSEVTSAVSGRGVCSRGVPAASSAWCFDRLVVGTAALGMSRAAGRSHWRELAHIIVARLNATQVMPAPGSGVLFLIKTGGRALANMGELLKATEAACGCAAVAADPAAMSLHEQAVLVRSAAVVVTPPGAVSFSLALAHEDSALVVLNAMTAGPSRDAPPTAYRLEGWLWDADPGADVTHVTLGQEDLVPLDQVGDAALFSRLRGNRSSGNMDLFWKYSLLRPRPGIVVPAVVGAASRAARRIARRHTEP